MSSRASGRESGASATITVPSGPSCLGQRRWCSRNSRLSPTASESGGGGEGGGAICVAQRQPVGHYSRTAQPVDTPTVLRRHVQWDVNDNILHATSRNVTCDAF